MRAKETSAARYSSLPSPFIERDFEQVRALLQLQPCMCRRLEHGSQQRGGSRCESRLSLWQRLPLRDVLTPQGARLPLPLELFSKLARRLACITGTCARS